MCLLVQRFHCDYSSVVIAEILDISIDQNQTVDFNSNRVAFFHSEFPDIFDWTHFKKVLADDVRIVSTLPASHIGTTPDEETQTPLHVSPERIRSMYLKKVSGSLNKQKNDFDFDFAIHIDE